MPPIPPKERFSSAYASTAPWEIGAPQRPFVDHADQITGRVFDSGCGTGETSLFFAARGCDVTGIDFLDIPVQRAKASAAQQNLAVRFLVKDALTLPDWNEEQGKFDNIIDSGLFHVFPDDDRKRYVLGLAHVLKKGGRLFLACFSDSQPGDAGPRRVSRKELEDSFASGWIIESIEPVIFAIHPSFHHMFPPPGARAWFAVVRRA